MNRRWVIPLAAAAAGLVAYGVVRLTVCGRCAPSLDRLQDLTFLARELKLDDAQAGRIRELHAALGARLNDCCQRHCAARARLAAALAAETNGTAEADAIVAEMCRAYEASERATLEQIRQVRAALTAEQRARFDVLISDCMCRTCSMPGGKAEAHAH